MRLEISTDEAGVLRNALSVAASRFEEHAKTLGSEGPGFREIVLKLQQQARDSRRLIEHLDEVEDAEAVAF